MRLDGTEKRKNKFKYKNYNNGSVHFYAFRLGEKIRGNGDFLITCEESTFERRCVI